MSAPILSSGLLATGQACFALHSALKFLLEVHKTLAEASFVDSVSTTTMMVFDLFYETRSLTVSILSNLHLKSFVSDLPTDSYCLEPRQSQDNYSTISISVSYSSAYQDPIITTIRSKILSTHQCPSRDNCGDSISPRCSVHNLSCQHLQGIESCNAQSSHTSPPPSYSISAHRIPLPQ